MALLLRVSLALALNYSAALAAWWVLPARAPGRTIRTFAALLAGMVCNLAAIVVPLDYKPIRFALAVIGVITASRIAIYLIEGIDASLREYFRFISLAMLRPYLVFTRDVQRARPRIGWEVLRFCIPAALIPPSWWITGYFVTSAPSERHWCLNHLIVLAGFIVIMTCVGQSLLALWHLQGLAVRRPIADNILASRTPADFWQRWSWPPHVALMRYIYRPAGGRRHHTRAVLAVFLASGLAHELLFAVAIGRVTGHQTLFFLVNGFGVLAAPSLERIGTRGVAGRGIMRTLTILFLIAASPLFFVSFHYVTPIYMKSIWLMW